MTKKFLTITICTALFLNSCKETPRQEKDQTTINEVVNKSTDDIILSSSTDKNGKKLEISINNTKETATLNFNEEIIELVGQKPASGIWYKNENYELRGKGNDLELTKNGILIFEHKDDIVATSLKNKKNETLDMTFNNTLGTVKVYLNGREQIDLVAEKAASGIWYKNEQYELRGKGEKLVLTKNRKTVFEN